MSDESRYTIDDAPEPPAPEDASAPDVSAEPAAEAAGGASPESPEETAREATGVKDAWRDVLTQLDTLGDSMSRWAKAAVNDPENRRHAAEIRSKIDAMSAKVTSTVDEATHTEVGRSVAEAADKTGRAIADAGGKVAQETAPAVASALTSLAEFLGKAAERVGQTVEEKAAATAEPAGDEPAATEAARVEPDAERAGDVQDGGA